MRRVLWISLFVISLLLVAKVDHGQSKVNQRLPNSVVRMNSNPNGLKDYLNERSWDSLFPHRYGYGAEDSPGLQADFYTLRAFIAAAGMFPGFLSEGVEQTRKKELVAFLASIAYETGGGWSTAPGGYWRWGLFYKEEKASAGNRYLYIDSTKRDYPPFPGMSYHGRGPMQLSWNYNYGQFGEAWFGDKDSLLRNPDLLSTDSVLSFASAIWFWMTPQYPKPSCHDIMVGNWKPNHLDSAQGRLPGFGAVVNVINGGVECGHLMENKNTNFRYGYYLFFCDYFGVPAGDYMECGLQKPFGQ